MIKDKPLIVQVSFKNNDIYDIELYNWICKHQYKSAFVKTILREKMKEELAKNH